MRVLRLWMCAAVLAPVALAQPPSFEASRVLPSGGSQPIPLAPGLLMSIYGSHLGPPSGCQGAGDTQHRETPSPLRPNQAFVETLIYPKELCGVRVLVGNMPAGLLYVQEQQINFKVPQETAVTGTTQLRVIYNGQSSASVTLPLGLQTVTLALEQPATVDTPVWLHVAIPYGEGAIRYPYGLWPAYFACVDIEVRRNGKLLPHMATLASQAFNGVAMSGPPCGSAAPDDPRYRDRLPLHLQYRFAEPGSYEVRYTERSPFVQNRVLQSAWTRIEILPSSPGARARWLAAKLQPTA